MKGRHLIRSALAAASVLVSPLSALPHFDVPAVAPYFDFQSQFDTKGVPPKILQGHKTQYCVALTEKTKFLLDLESWQRHNFSRLKAGTWFNYLVSTEKNGKPKYLGFEKWKIMSVSQETGEAMAWVLDTDGATHEVPIHRRDLTHEGVRPNAKSPTTCLLQDTIVGRIKRGQRKLMGKQWDTLQYYRSPLSSADETIEIVKDAPLGFGYIREEKGADTIVRELDGFHF